jgi:putative DNA primase/helicase
LGKLGDVNIPRRGMSCNPVVAMIAASDEPVDRLEVVRISDVQSQPVRWLWPGRFALGKLSLIAGDPGLGKSMLLLAMAAHISRGRRWPDGSECPVGSVLLICGEDDVADTIRPRLEAAGADLSRIEIVTMANDKGGRRGFDLERDSKALLAKASAMTDCRLINIDPISAYLGKTDSHSNAEVRGLLAKLAEGVGSIGAALVMVSHLNKGTEKGNALYRPNGSLAFVAAARTAYIVVKDRDDPKRRLFLPMKQNLSPDGDGLAFRVAVRMNGAPYLVFERAPVTMTANEALAAAPAAPKPRESASDWLRERLANGPVAAKEIWDDANACGFAEATVKRAKKQLGVDAVKVEGTLNGGWLWRLPAPEEGREGDQTASKEISCAEGDHFSYRRKFDPLAESDPLRSGSHHRRGSKNCLTQSDPLRDAGNQLRVDEPDGAAAAPWREFDL